MKKTKRLTDLQIIFGIKNRTLHFIPTIGERKRVLAAAGWCEILLSTKEKAGGGFIVLYPSQTS